MVPHISVALAKFYDCSRLLADSFALVGMISFFRLIAYFKIRAARDVEAAPNPIGAAMKIMVNAIGMQAARVRDYRHLRLRSDTQCHRGRRDRTTDTTDHCCG